jgi:hypothetical protein
MPKPKSLQTKGALPIAPYCKVSEQLFSGWQQALATVRERFPLLTYEAQGKEWHVRDTSNLSGKGRPTLILLPGSLGSADIFFRQMLAPGSELA